MSGYRENELTVMRQENAKLKLRVFELNRDLYTAQNAERDAIVEAREHEHELGVLRSELAMLRSQHAQTVDHLAERSFKKVVFAAFWGGVIGVITIKLMTSFGWPS